MDIPIFSEEISLREAMRELDETESPFGVVITKGIVEGIVTSSDIRSALFQGKSNSQPIKDIIRTVYPYYDEDRNLNAPMALEGIPFQFPIIPIIDKNKKFIGVEPLKEMEVITNNGKPKKKRILVIGGAGYIGYHVSRKLIEKGYQVRIFDSLIYGDSGLKQIMKLDADIEFIKGDLCDIKQISDALVGVDGVIHLAAIVGDPASKANPKLTLLVNHFSTLALGNMCKYLQINKFIFASTCSVYGKNEDEKLLTEESPTNPLSLYAETKQLSEKALLSLKDENFKPTILRFGTIFGWSERMRFDLVINIMTAKAHYEKKINVFGGSQWRPLLHVEDAANAIIMALEAPIKKVGGEIFNVGDDDFNFTIEQLAYKVKDVIPDAEIVIHEKDFDLRDYRVDFSKIRRVLGFKNKVGIEEGIKEIYKNLKERNIDYTDPIYHNAKYLLERNKKIILNQKA